MLSGAVAGGFDVAIFCASVVLVAVIIVWVLGLCGYPPPPNVMKVGKIFVLLICLSAVVLFLLSLIGGFAYPGPHFFRP